MAQIRLITVQQAADTYNVSASTIRRYIARGQLVGYRIGPRLIKVDAEQAAAVLLTPAYNAEQAAAVLQQAAIKPEPFAAQQNNEGDSPK